MFSRVEIYVNAVLQRGLVPKSWTVLTRKRYGYLRKTLKGGETRCNNVNMMPFYREKQLNETTQTEHKNGNVLLRQLHVCLALSSPASRRIPSLRARARSLERANKLASARARGCPSSAVWSLWCVSDSASAARERDLRRERAGSWSDRYPPTGDLSFSFLIPPYSLTVFLTL